MGQSLFGRLLPCNNMAGQRVDHLRGGGRFIKRKEAGLPVPTSTLDHWSPPRECALRLCVTKNDLKTPALGRPGPSDRGWKSPYPCVGQAAVVSLFSLGSHADRLRCGGLPLPPAAAVDPLLSLLGHRGGVVPHLHGGALSPRRPRGRLDRGCPGVGDMAAEKKNCSPHLFLRKLKGYHEGEKKKARMEAIDVGNSLLACLCWLTGFSARDSRRSFYVGLLVRRRSGREACLAFCYQV